MQFRTSSRMKPWQGILFGLVFALIGSGLIWFSVNIITEYNKKNSEFRQVTGQVVDYNYNDDGLQAIIVEYTVDGQSYRKTSNSYSNMPKSTGTEVDLKYNPTNPKDAIWVNDSTNIVMPLAGGLFALVGIVVIVIAAKKMKNGEEYM